MPTPQQDAPAQNATPPDPVAGGAYIRDPITLQLTPDPGIAVDATTTNPETTQE